MITEKLKWLKCVLLSQCRIIKIKKYNFTIEYTHKTKLVTYSTIEGIYLSIFKFMSNISICQSIISLPLYRVKVSSYIKSLLFFFFDKIFTFVKLEIFHVKKLEIKLTFKKTKKIGGRKKEYLKTLY